MPVNPYSTPIKLEYKPLGIEAFAKPFSEMREKFDTAQKKIDETEFELSRLAKDDERAAAMLQEVQSARDELAQNLATTGNYRQATQKLIKMNRQFNKGDETLAIKTNYDNYQKALEEQKDRVKSGKITPEDLEMWKFNTVQSFKGTGYDTKTKEYNSITLTPFSDNLQKEIEEKALELARMTVADKTVAYQNLKAQGVSDVYAQEILKTTTETKPLERIKDEIAGYLKASDRYKHFINERGEAEFKYNQFRDPGFGQKYVDSLLQNNAATIAQFEKALTNPNLTADQKTQYTQGLQNYQKVQEDLQTNLGIAQEKGSLGEYAKKLYVADKQGVFNNLATRAGDLVDYTFVNNDLSTKIDEGAKKKLEETSKKVKEVGAININVTATTGDKNTIVTSGQATSTEDVLQNKRNAYEQIKATPIDKVPGLENVPIDLTAAQLGGDANKKEFDDILSTSKNLYVVQNRLYQMSETQKDIDAEIKLKKEALGKATNGDVKEGISRELDALFQDKKELEIARTDDTKTLDLILESTIATAPKEIQELYKTTYQNNPYDFFEVLRTAVNNDAKKVSIGQAQSARIQQEFAENPALVRDQTGELRIAVPNIENPVNSTLKEKSALTKFANKVMDAYVYNIKSSFATLGVETAIDEKSDKFTDGALLRTANYAKENQTGSSEVKKVELNTLTGQTKEDSKGNNYNLAYYEETPHYAGVDQNGSVILRYVRKPNIKQNEIAAAVKSEFNIPTVQGAPFVLSDSQKNEWEKSNPENLYVTVKGRTNDIVNSAEDNYRDMMKYGLAVGGEEGFTAVQQTLQNFAAMHVIADPKRRELYFEMASRLKDAVDNDHRNTNLVQAPAVWNKNQNGTYSGFMINYQVVDRNVVGIVSEITMNPDRTFSRPVPVKSVVLNDVSNNLTTALAGMDLMYGTGREADVVKSPITGDFVPAFNMNPSFNTLQIDKGF